MKIGFCLISNRPEKTIRFINSFQHAIVKGYEYSFHLSYEKQFTNEHLRIIKEKINQIDKSIKVIFSKRETETGRFHYYKSRMHSFSTAEFCDYLIMVDDDIVFTDGKQTKKYKWSAGERYIDAVKYLENNSNCGIVYMKSYLGGASLGRKFIMMRGGFFDTGLGVVFRGKSRKYKNIIDDIFNVPGGCVDTSIGISAIMNGYYAAKTFNTTAKKDQTKKMFIVKGKSDKNNSSDPAYSFSYLETKGVISVLIKRYGYWKFGGKLPDTLIDEYRENALKNKLKVVMVPK